MQSSRSSKSSNTLYTRNLLGWFPFERNADDNYMGNITTFNSGTSISDAFKGLKCNGTTSDYLEISDNMDYSNFNLLSKQFTLSMWINTSDIDGQILSKESGDTSNDEFRLEINSSGNVVFHADGTDILTGNYNYADGDWHHVALTRLGNDAVELYIDGTLDTSDTVTTNYIVDQPIKVGKGLNCYIADLRIFDRGMTDREIKRLKWEEHWRKFGGSSSSISSISSVSSRSSTSSSSVSSGGGSTENYIYSGGIDATVRKIDISDKSEIWQFTGDGNSFNGVAVDTAGDVYACDIDNVYKIGGNNGTESWRFTGHTSEVYSVASDAGDYAHSASWDGTVRRLNGSDGTEVWQFTEHGHYALDVAVDTNGYTYSSGDNYMAYKIDSGGDKVWEFTHNGYVEVVSVDDAGDYVYTGTWDGDNAARKLKGSDGTEVWKNSPDGSAIMGVDVDSNGVVYCGGGGNNVYKISADGSSILWTFSGHSSEINHLVVDSPGNYVYSGSDDNYIFKIDASDGTEVWRFTGNNDSVESLAIGP